MLTVTAKALITGQTLSKDGRTCFLNLLPSDDGRDLLRKNENGYTESPIPVRAECPVELLDTKKGRAGFSQTITFTGRQLHYSLAGTSKKTGNPFIVESATRLVLTSVDLA